VGDHSSSESGGKGGMPSLRLDPWRKQHRTGGRAARSPAAPSSGVGIALAARRLRAQFLRNSESSRDLLQAGGQSKWECKVRRACIPADSGAEFHAVQRALDPGDGIGRMIAWIEVSGRSIIELLSVHPPARIVAGGGISEAMVREH